MSKYRLRVSITLRKVGHVSFHLVLSLAMRWESPCQLCHSWFLSTPHCSISASKSLYICRSFGPVQNISSTVMTSRLHMGLSYFSPAGACRMRMSQGAWDGLNVSVFFLVPAIRGTLRGSLPAGWEGANALFMASAFLPWFIQLSELSRLPSPVSSR